MKLQDWFNSNMPAENLVYAGAAKSQIMWVRDSLSYAIWNSLMAKNPEIKDWRATLTVDGTHRSKSVLLPVYRFDAGDITIKVRGNFHDWCVRYWGPEPKRFPSWMGAYDREGFYEGMAGEFSPVEFCIGEKEKLYAAIWWMLNEGLEEA